MRMCCIAMAMALAAAPFSGAAEPQLSVIREIRYVNTGKGALDLSFVNAHTTVRVGDELSRSAVNQDVKALLGTRRYGDVAVDAESVENGIRLIYRLRKRPRLANPMEIRGVEHFRESRVREWIGLVPGDLVDDDILGAATRKVIGEYRDDLYPDAAVTWKIRELEEDASLVDVRVEIKEGGRARLAAVAYIGNRQMPESELRKVYKRPSRLNPINWIRRAKYDPDTLDAAREKVLVLYRNRGFLDARVLQPVIGRNEEGQVVVRIEIQEGVPYRFGDISLQGSGLEVLPESSLRQKVSARTGEVASWETIRSIAGGLRDEFGSRGYIETSVRPLLDADSGTGTVNVRFDIREGPLTYIRNILIRGNTRTRDKVVRREMLVYPGEIFDEVKVRRSERILSNLGFFSEVRTDKLDTPVPGRKDLVFSVEEKRTGQFMVGMGFSSIDKLIGFAELSQGNFDLGGWPYFTGGGQKLKLSTQLGSTRDEFIISFVEPWFMDRKLSLGVDLYRTDVDYSDYDQSRTGGAVSLGKPLFGSNRIQFLYRLEHTEIRDVADTNDYVRLDNPEEEYDFMEENDYVKSEFEVRLTHDSRNNPFVPTRGNRAQLFASLAGGPLNFDTDIYGLGLRTWSYQPLWFRHVISLRTRWEVVEAYGGSGEVPLGDMLFIGGGRTIRGYEYRDVGPKAVRADDPLGERGYRNPGGQTMGLASIEYTIPIVRAVRLAAFYDVGNVWRDPYDFDLSHTASGAGVGVRLDVPGFPIRIDRAWAVEKDDEITEEDEWVIWIGFDN